jgi:hypothetical protein
MRGLAAMAITRRWSAGRPRPATPDSTGEVPVSPSINTPHSGGDECVRSYVRMTIAWPLAPSLTR